MKIKPHANKINANLMHITIPKIQFADFVALIQQLKIKHNAELVLVQLHAHLAKLHSTFIIIIKLLLLAF